jgi:hypothetical protein
MPSFLKFFLFAQTIEVGALDPSQQWLEVH